MFSIVIVDNNTNEQKKIDSLLSEQFDITSCSNYKEAMKISQIIQPDIIIVGLKEKGIPDFSAVSPDSKMIFTSTKETLSSFLINTHNFGYLEQPYSLDSLQKAIGRLLITKNNTCPESTAEINTYILGNSPIIENINKEIRLFAAHSGDVLITGECGTGKELAANAIHRLSKRRQNPFIPVDCASIPETLAESILFGSIKGAYTGALGNQGVFELANKGSLFLDEIGEMPLSLQAKFLRVLESREGCKIGSAKREKYDTRIISATNAPIYSNSEKFRKDLLSRLDKLVIHMPSLREHKEDIELISNSFLNGFDTEKELSNQSIDKLQQWDWPGNVRELKNVIYRACVISDKEYTITPEHITIHNQQQLF